MARSSRQTSEDLLAELSDYAALTERPAQQALIKRALADKSCRVVAKAASLCAEHALREYVEELKAAYQRFLASDPAKRDPHCTAKQAIVRALVDLDCSDIEFFRAGLRYRQLEPVWGGSVDTATDVRSACAMGMVASGYWRALPEVVELLADKEVRVREGAARAISCGNPQAAEVLLRFKVLTGDSEPQVIGECFTGLMAIAADESLAFVAGYLLDPDDAIRDLAALALGESRHPEAIKHLMAAWDEVVHQPEFRVVLIRAAAVHRSDAAFDWLLKIIEQAPSKFADAAVEALAVYERNTKLAARIEEALTARRKLHADDQRGNGE
jgi:HEAT repeats